VTVVDDARRLAPRLAARAAGYDRDGTFPVDDFADLRAAGMFGLMVPVRLGGLGASFAAYTDVAYELARGNVIVRDLTRSEQVEVPLTQAADHVARALRAPR